MRWIAFSAFLLIGASLQVCKAAAAGKAEIAVMTKAKHAMFIGNKHTRNPIAYSPQSVVDGKQAFSHYCVFCHGMDGQNTGVPFADTMDPPVPSLASQDVQAYSDGQLKWVIDNGMPAATGILSDDEQWQIVLFLGHLPPAGSLEEPKMYGK